MHLPARDLLLVQRVSRSFKQTVKSSTALRRILFLEPGKAESTTVNDQDMICSDHVTGGKIAFNPLLVSEHWAESPTKPCGAQIGGYRIIEPFRNKSASCRQMFVTQPPLEFENSLVSVNKWFDRDGGCPSAPICFCRAGKGAKLDGLVRGLRRSSLLERSDWPSCTIGDWIISIADKQPETLPD